MSAIFFTPHLITEVVADPKRVIMATGPKLTRLRVVPEEEFQQRVDAILLVSAAEVGDMMRELGGDPALVAEALNDVEAQ